jgi:hypothetical protein
MGWTVVGAVAIAQTDISSIVTCISYTMGATCTVTTTTETNVAFSLNKLSPIFADITSS